MTIKIRPVTILLVTVAACMWAQFGLATSFCFASDRIKDLQTFGQLGEKAIGREVDLLATVTYIEPFSGFIFIEDNEQAVFVSSVSTKGLRFGDRVRVVGTARKGDLSPTILARSVLKADPEQQSTTPTPLNVKISEFTLGDFDARYVRVRGTVLQAVSAQGQTLVLCEDNGVQFHVSIDGARKLDEMWNWIGTTVDSVGVLAITLKAGIDRDGRSSNQGRRD